MLKVTKAFIEDDPTLRYGYYLIRPEKQYTEATSGGFIMPEEEDGNLSVGLIISSGETFFVQGEQYDQDFTKDALVVFRDRGSMPLEIDGVEYRLVPQENVFLELYEDVDVAGEDNAE